MGLSRKNGQGTTHERLWGRGSNSAHPIGAITGLSEIWGIVYGFTFIDPTGTDNQIIIPGTAPGQKKFFLHITSAVTGATIEFSHDAGETFHSVYDTNDQLLASFPVGFHQIYLADSGRYYFIS